MLCAGRPAGVGVPAVSSRADAIPAQL